MDSGTWIGKMSVCLIAGREHCRAALDDAVEAALRGGVRTVHLREKQATTRQLYEMGLRLRRLTRNYDTLLIINDRADVAVAVEADGVHLGWQSLPIAAVRRIVGSKALVGKSVHNLAEAQQAVSDSVDYIIASPIFTTPSKVGLAPTLGIEGLSEIRRHVGLPIIALGGIDPSNASDVIRAGADGIAVIRAILAADDPATAAARLVAGASSDL